MATSVLDSPFQNVPYTPFLHNHRISSLQRLVEADNRGSPAAVVPQIATPEMTSSCSQACFLQDSVPRTPIACYSQQSQQRGVNLEDIIRNMTTTPCASQTPGHKTEQMVPNGFTPLIPKTPLTSRPRKDKKLNKTDLLSVIERDERRQKNSKPVKALSEKERRFQAILSPSKQQKKLDWFNDDIFAKE